MGIKITCGTIAVDRPYYSTGEIMISLADPELEEKLYQAMGKCKDRDSGGII